MKLTLDRQWLDVGFEPATLYDSPFLELPNRPLFEDVLECATGGTTWHDDLASYGRALTDELRRQLSALTGEIHCMLSGGYDSRMIAFLLEELDKHALYVTDGTQEPQCTDTIELFGIPKSRVYVHDTSLDDPYRLAGASCNGFAPLYSQLSFTPPGKHTHATLVTGLGGGEWFSYPASDWHGTKRRRLPHDSLVNMWMDCWPQYALLPVAWTRPYGSHLYPYCTVSYARIAAQCAPEWLAETPGRPELDLVRSAMMDSLDPLLKSIGWAPHRYDWKLSEHQRYMIDERFYSHWISAYYDPYTGGDPSEMHHADHACTLAGLATWCEKLAENGYEIVVA